MKHWLLYLNSKNELLHQIQPSLTLYFMSRPNQSLLGLRFLIINFVFFSFQISLTLIGHFHHVILMCLEKILVHLFLKNLICNANSKQQRWECVCVCSCVSYEVTPKRRGRWCVCVCVLSWTPGPLPSIYTNLQSCISLCLSLSVSVCLSFVFQLRSICRLLLFI